MGDTYGVALHGQILDSEGPLGQETRCLRLQSSWGCGVSSGDLCVARFGDEGDQLIAVQNTERCFADVLRQWKMGE